jgi:hypothetical protein
VTPDRFVVPRSTLVAKLSADIPLHRLPVVVPIAAVGVAALVTALRRRGPVAGDGGRPVRRWASPSITLTMLLAWTLVSAAGILALAIGRTAPAHRFLAFLLPLSIFAGVGVLAVARLAGRGRPLAVSIAVAVASVAAIGFLGFRILHVELPRDRGVLWLDEAKVHDAAAAAAYLDAARVPEEETVVLIVDDTGPQPTSYVPLMANMIRTVMPPERIPHTYFYMGDVETFLSGEPTIHERSTNYYNRASRYFFRPLERHLAGRPLALILGASYPRFGTYVAEHPESLVAPGVAVVQGPTIRAPIRIPPIPRAPRPPIQLGLMAVAVLGVLVLVGLGWALALLPRAAPVFALVGLSPSFGIAFLVVAGIVVDAVGLPLSSWGALLTVLLAAAPGWGLAAVQYPRAARLLRLRR